MDNRESAINEGTTPRGGAGGAVTSNEERCIAVTSNEKV